MSLLAGLNLSPLKLAAGHAGIFAAGLCLGFAEGSVGAAESAGAPLPPEIENPQCLGINKEPAHATLMPYASFKEALAANRHASSYCRSLNGPWKFHWVKRPEERPVDFYKPEFDVSGWKEIPVPSNWQVLGYGTPYYRNAGYTIKKDFPHVMSEPPKDYTAYAERNPVGSYRREFELPAAWDGRRTFLTFDGVDSAFFLWINGQKVGFSVNSRNAAEFDVTKYVKPGKNMVAVEVYRYSSGTWLEDQDMWRLSGIFRNVTLWSAPQIHIRDFFVKTDLDKEYRNATVEVTVKVKNYGDTKNVGRILRATLFDSQGHKVAQQPDGLVNELASGQEQTVSMKFSVANPAKWTAETPNLYTLVLETNLVQQLYTVTELISTRVGFRKLEIDGRVFKVNGVPVKLKGVNRHEHWSDVGHAVTEAQMIRDLEVIKQGNCNHVRTCHYSDDPRWYELCDEWGIWLVAEANVECHGYDHRFDSEPTMRDAIIDRNVANAENFKNHPSVIIWSLGNECGGRGPNFIDAMNAVKAIDATRPVHYERFGRGAGNPADLDGQMYGTPAGFEATANDKNLTKPFYICEYAHAMFNSMGSIDEYSEMFDRCPAIVGGAIWEYQDQALWNKRDPKHPILAYGGGFGEKPNDHYFIHKGVVSFDRATEGRTTKPHYPEMKRAYQWIGIKLADPATGTLTIKNKHQFIDLSGFRAAWTLCEDGREIESGALKLPAVAPLSEATVAVPCKVDKPKAGAEYFLRVSFTLAQDELWAKKGYEVAAAQFKLPIAAATPVAESAAMKPVTLAQDDQSVTVTGSGFAVVFDKASGTLSRLERGGVNLLAAGGGPKLHLWRAPHRNDDMWAYGGWEANGVTKMTFSANSFKVEQAGPAAVRVLVTVKGEGKNGFAATHSAVYTVFGDGSVAVDNTVSFQGPQVVLARIGVRMLLDRKLDRFDYFGRGPLENYADRKSGFDVGLYGSSVADQQTPYEKPMECGNHEDVRWCAVTGRGMPGLLAQADGAAMQAAALPYTDEAMTDVEYKIDLPPSTATVLCLGAKTLGVGSNGCGPRPLERYIVRAQPVAWSYVLRLLPAGTKPTPETACVQAPARVCPVLASRDREGLVKLTCTTPGAKLSYRIAGQPVQPYAVPFLLKNAAELELEAAVPGMLPFRGTAEFPQFCDHSRWKIISCSSFQADEGEAVHAIDGDVSTFWHTQWKPTEPKHPHELVIGFGAALKIAGISYRARLENPNGRVKAYEVYFSEDGKVWSQKPAISGAFKNSEGVQLAMLKKPLTANFMKFVAKSEVSGGPWASVAELDIVSAE